MSGCSRFEPFRRVLDLDRRRHLSSALAAGRLLGVEEILETASRLI